MSLGYKYFEAQYNRRLKGRDFKAFATYWALTKNEANELVFCGTAWVKKDPSGKEGDSNYHRVADKKRVFAVMTPDNVLTLMKNIDSMSDVNVLRKIIPHGGGIYCDKSTTRMTKYRLKYPYNKYATPRADPFDVPLVNGLQFDVERIKPLTEVAEVKRVTDRAASQAIYKRVEEIINLMVVLHKMGGITAVGKYGSYKALAEANKSLDEENMLTLAEAAYQKALNVTIGSRETWNNEQRAYVVDPVKSAAYDKRVISNARRHLTQVLKEEHGGFKVVPK